jgi:hypothetical protein
MEFKFARILKEFVSKQMAILGEQFAFSMADKRNFQ